MIRQGQKIYGPDGQGYEALVDISPMMRCRPDMFEAFGGAPKPEPAGLMPDWLVKALQARFD